MCARGGEVISLWCDLPPRAWATDDSSRSRRSEHVGAVLEARFGVRFIRVEPIFLALANPTEAFTEIQRTLDRGLAEARFVAIESTGIATEHLQALEQRYQPVRLIRVHASAETCWRRFTYRDASSHIPVSEERFREINALAARVILDWDCELDNDPGLTDNEIAEAEAATL